MSQSANLSEPVKAVADLIRSGDFPAARSQFRQLLKDSTEHERAVLAQCGHLLSNFPRTGVAHLQEYWRRSDDATRAIVAACAPAPGEQRQRPELAPDRAPRWNRQNKHQAPKADEHGNAINVRRVRPQRNRRSKAGTYVAGTHGADDDRTRPAPITSRRDHDYDALEPAGRVCIALACHIELSAADHREGDWLCGECRELGRPGIDPLPKNHTRMEALKRLCAYIWANYPYAVDRLRAIWSAQGSEGRDTVTAWVAAHVPPESTEPAPEGCECGSVRQVRNGLCVECRKLESAPVAVTTESAAPADEPAEHLPLAA